MKIKKKKNDTSHTNNNQNESGGCGEGLLTETQLDESERSVNEAGRHTGVVCFGASLPGAA